MKKLASVLIALSLFGSGMAFANGPAASKGHVDGRAKCGLAACYAGGAGVDGYAPDRPKAQTAEARHCQEGYRWVNSACVPYVYAGGSGNGGGYEG
jgi:hypothetical protein